MGNLKQRPTCACCDKPYGRRHAHSEKVRWDTPTTVIYTSEKRPITVLDGEAAPPPPYHGNGIVVKESSPYLSADDGRMVMHREIWDGKTWWKPYDPFCTLRCAMAFARKAYAAGYTMKRRTV